MPECIDGGFPSGETVKAEGGHPRREGMRFRGASLERARANEPPDERNLAGEKEHGQPLRSRHVELGQRVAIKLLRVDTPQRAEVYPPLRGPNR